MFSCYHLRQSHFESSLRSWERMWAGTRWPPTRRPSCKGNRC